MDVTGSAMISAVAGLAGAFFGGLFQSRAAIRAAITNAEAARMTAETAAKTADILSVGNKKTPNAKLLVSFVTFRPSGWRSLSQTWPNSSQLPIRETKPEANRSMNQSAKGLFC